ncbi:MAG: hypothetical protein ABUK01_09960 [Leptospirales bacterium]
MKRIAYIMILVTFSLVVLEYWFRNYNELERGLSDYSTGVIAEIENFNEKIEAEVQSGKFSRYFWLNSLSEDTLKEIESVNHAVKSVVLIDKNFHVFASTNGNFQIESLLPYLKGLKNNGSSKMALLPGGIFGIYKVLGYYGDKAIGYLVFETAIKAYHPETVTFFIPPSRNFIRINEPERVSLNEIKKIEQKLIEVSLSEESFTSVDLGRPHRIIWKRIPLGDNYVGLLLPTPSLNGYYSIYAFIISLFLLGFIFFREKTDVMTNSDVIRMILEKNRDSLDILRNNMGKIENALKPQDFKIEKPVEGSVVLEKNQVAAQPIHMRVVEEWGEEMEPPEMQFVLLDPMQEEWLVPAKEKFDLKEIEKAEELRQRAFSDELMNLMDEVGRGKKDVVDSLGREVEIFEEQFADMRFSEYGRILQRLYEASEPTEEMEAAFHYIKESMHADGLCLMFFDNQIGCYSYIMGAGVEDFWRHHVYILYNDPIIKVSTEEVCDTTIASEKRIDPFFAKRFPAEEIGSIAGLRTVPLHSFKMNGLLLAIYNKKSDQEEGDEWISRAGEYSRVHGDVYIHGIIPALRKAYHTGQHFHARYQYKELLRELKGAILTRTGPITVLHAEVTRQWNKEELRYIESESEQLMKYNEKLIISTPNHIVMILHETTGKQITPMFDEVSEEIEYREYVYPDYGKSLFIYI